MCASTPKQVMMGNQFLQGGTAGTDFKFLGTLWLGEVQMISNKIPEEKSYKNLCL